jgi:hypothetical protein
LLSEDADALTDCALLVVAHELIEELFGGEQLLMLGERQDYQARIIQPAFKCALDLELVDMGVSDENRELLLLRLGFLLWAIGGICLSLLLLTSEV